MTPPLSQWSLELLLQGAILGVLLMMYADQRASHLKSRRWPAVLHLLTVYFIGLALVVKLVIELLAHL